MSKGHRKIVVVGLGMFGSTVAKELARFGNEVIGIDVDDKLVNTHADEVDQALILDARDDAALREAAINEVDVGIVAIGSDMEASILASINLKTLGVKELWAKATSKNHHRILIKLGVDRVIHPEAEVGQRIAQMVNNPMVRDFASLGNSYYFVNVRVPETLQGKALADLDHEKKFELRCIGVMRGTEYIGRDGEECTLEADDLLLLLGKRSALRDFADNLA